MPHVILRPYFLSFRSRLLGRARSHHYRKRDLLLFVIAFIIMACIYTGLTMVFHIARRDPALIYIVPAKMVELAFHYFFILLLISNTVAATGNIYSSENMNLFLAAPVSSVRLYFAKFLETLAETSIMFFVFTSPAALAYVHALNVPYTFLLAAAAIAIPFLVIPVGIAVVLSTIFTHLLSFIWRRGTLLLIGVIFVFVWVISRVSSELGQAKVTKTGASSLIQLTGIYDNPSAIWMPSRWAADLAASFVGVPLESGTVKITLLIAAALASMSLGYLVFDLFVLYVRSSSGSDRKKKEVRIKHGASRDIVRYVFERLYGLFPLEQQIRAVILKDLSSLLRDRAQALQLILYLGIAALYITVFGFMGAAFTLEPIALQLWLGLLASINVLFSGFILTTAMTRLVYPSMSLEGRAFWVMQVTPINIARLVKAKFYCWLPLTTFITVSVLLSGGIAIGLEKNMLFLFTVVGCFFAIGYTGLAIGLGSTYASFDWESPSQIAVGFGTLVLLLTSLMLVLIMAVPCSIMAFTFIVPRIRVIMGPAVSFSITSLCLFFVIAMNLLVASVACRKGAESLEARRASI